MFKHVNSEVYVPDGVSLEQALQRTTHLAISAHQDDIEIMAIDGILKCFQQPDLWFSGVVATDGRSSPRSGLYADMSNEDMMRVRYEEQKKAALVGDYSCQVMLGYTSGEMKDAANPGPFQDLLQILRSAKPRVVYTHNLADKHPTHVAVAMRVLAALRALDEHEKPEWVYGCEVWRNLDWLADESKVVFNCSERLNLQEALVGVFDSQISGGKRYDSATMGRRLANATYFESHDTDEASHQAFAMDLTPLVRDPKLDIADFVCAHIQHFEADVRASIKKAS